MTPPMVAWFDRQIERLERDHAQHKARIAELAARLDDALQLVGEG